MRQHALALAAVVSLCAGSAFAQSTGVAVGAQLGTPGVGASVQMKASESLVLRGDLDWMRFGYDRDYSGVEYDSKLKSFTGGAFADFHPGGGPLMVSAGAYYGTRKLDLDARPTGTVDIGGQSFTPAQIGEITGEARMSKLQPFLGLGYDNTFSGTGGWGFRAVAGVAFSKDPSVDLIASGGTLATDPNFQARLAQEEADVRDDARRLRYFPVVQVGITRQF